MLVAVLQNNFDPGPGVWGNNRGLEPDWLAAFEVSPPAGLPTPNSNTPPSQYYLLI